MLELNTNAFLGATTQLSRLHAIINGLENKNERLVDATVDLTTNGLENFKREVEKLGGRLAWVHANRLVVALQPRPIVMTVGELANVLWEIESRFADHMESVKLFALTEIESHYTKSAQELFGQQICDNFPSILYDLEEAAKCIALSRSTASVFHFMRALEPAIRALATFLEIPDPTKPSDKNWGTILGDIKTELDRRYPKSGRMPGTDGAIVESIYATLDAIKNPWRNATMHAEATYQPFEASHIAQCVNVFLLKVSGFIDENGARVSP